MTKLITAAFSVLFATVVLLQGAAMASGNGPPKGGNSSSRQVTTSGTKTGSYNSNTYKAINNNKTVINNTNSTYGSKTNSNSYASKTLSNNSGSYAKQFSAPWSSKSSKYSSNCYLVHGCCSDWWCGWFGGWSPGYCCGSYGWCRPAYWWYGDCTPIVIVEPIYAGQPATGATPSGDAGSGPVEAVEPTPPAKGPPGGM
jgi:hypothetical protein